MEPKPAPTTLSGIIRHLGPGLIITATIVGSGELIATPKLAAETGYSPVSYTHLTLPTKA